MYQLKIVWYLFLRINRFFMRKWNHCEWGPHFMQSNNLRNQLHTYIKIVYYYNVFIVGRSSHSSTKNVRANKHKTYRVLQTDVVTYLYWKKWYHIQFFFFHFLFILLGSFSKYLKILSICVFVGTKGQNSAQTKLRSPAPIT